MTYREQALENGANYFLLCLADAEIAQLKAERDALLKDAGRYRWLRDKAPGEIVFDHTRDQRDGGNHFALHVPFDGREIPDDEASGRALDEAIDAAMKQEPKT